MNGFFGKRNAWADGPPPGGGNFDPTVGGPRGNLADALRQARTEVRALVYQRKRRKTIGQFFRRHGKEILLRKRII